MNRHGFGHEADARHGFSGRVQKLHAPFGVFRHLAGQRNERTNEPLSKATVYTTVTALKAFFMWLAEQPGYKSRISYADTENFNLNMKDTRIAKAAREPRVPTLEQIHHVLRSMPDTTEIEVRDRALIAFTILPVAVDGALVGVRAIRERV